jgi:endonuclease/exonuclease/phosphatase family metal-dependent hydrolase
MLKLMSFNIRYGTADDGANHWENRKSLVIDRIKTFDPDLLGMQECRDDFQAEFIKSNLQEYEFYGVRRGGGSVTALEMTPILLKRSAFQLVQKGCFWLSETPGVPGSRSWGSTFPRTATWAQLIHKVSGREFIFLNTHFDYEPSAIDESARLLQAWITHRKEKHPVIVTGDFNADKGSSAYRQLISETSLRDAYKQVHPNNENEGTFHGFGQMNDPSPIDWMLASDSFEVVSAAIDRYHAENIYPSDHYPVHAELQWKISLK